MIILPVLPYGIVDVPDHLTFVITTTDSSFISGITICSAGGTRVQKILGSIATVTPSMVGQIRSSNATK